MTQRTWLVDLDGVVWLAGAPIAGAPEALNRLRTSGDRVAYFTNNSFPLHHELLEMLADVGIELASDDLLSSGQAAAQLCQRGEQALVLGGPGIAEALEARGVQVTFAQDATTSSFDVVVAGIDTAFDYERLANAMHAVGGGARLIGTNDDATYPTASGPLPGAGAVLAALACATGVDPVVAGKPHPPAAELVRTRLGEVSVVIGDRPSTDGALATALGSKFALVLSGVTKPNHGSLTPKPDYEASDLAHLLGDLDGAARRASGEEGG